jgi:hypothetical protein
MTPLTIVSIVLVGYLYYRFIHDGTVDTYSQLDNKIYKVQNTQDRQRKADILAMIRGKLEKIVSTLAVDSRYNSQTNVMRLLKHWKRGISIKEIGNMENDAAYVINKQFMSFCLKNNNESIEYNNLITYVGIHELAHIMSVETGHNEEFKNNFKFLLNYAKNLEWVDPKTNVAGPLYIELSKLNTPDSYCGVLISNSMN